MKNLLTIFTPTYNRAYSLKNLYESLLNQKNNSFTWLIVDDGSSDNTKKIVELWINENLINIKYIYQENQGKHIAHNTALDNCETELFFCVDSDDYLLEHAIDDILDSYDKIKENDICGIVSTRISPCGKPLYKEMPNIVNYSSLSELYEKYKFKGDTALIFKTEILKKYKFPKIDNEKFIGEEYIYCQIDDKYKLYVSSGKYYVCEYLEDGYTKNIFKLITDNPKGYTLLKKMKLRLSKNFIIKYKSAALYVVGGWLSNSTNIIKESPNKVITIMSIPLAVLIYFVRFRRIIKKGHNVEQ